MAADPLHVLMSADTVGGVWTFAMDLIAGLKEYNVQVSLATLGPIPDKDKIKQAARLDNLTLYSSRYKLEWMPDPWEDIAKAGNWLLDLNAHLNPDVVHLNHLAHGSLNWQKPILTTVHSCVLSWWKAVKGEPATMDWNTYRELVTQSLRASDVVTAPSRSMLQTAQLQYGPFNSSMAIHNGRDQSIFSRGEKEKIIFSMGRLWDEAKNISSLCRIASALPYPVFIAGQADEPGTNKVAQFKNVHFLGKLNPTEIAWWLSRSAVYALPVKYEPFGLSFLEAALSGCRIIGGDIPSLHEIWGDTIGYADVGNDYSIQQSILTAIRQFERNEPLKSLERARYFTNQRMAQKYLSIYKNLAYTKYMPSIPAITEQTDVNGIVNTMQQ